MHSAMTDPWWSKKSYPERQGIMDRQATQREVDRIQSNRAPATWWSSLSLTRKHAVYEAEKDANPSLTMPI
jgi:hypothetical protein